jgi:hypothetical protein
MERAPCAAANAISVPGREPDGRQRRGLPHDRRQDVAPVGAQRHGFHGTLDSLFSYSYRDKMFHNGLEWPARECRRFARHIEQEKWQNLFESAKDGVVGRLQYKPQPDPDRAD